MTGSERPRAIRATLRGRVTGVGFRAATVERARALGVLGWVRNAEDDRDAVQVHAEGPADAVGALEAFLRDGPPGAQVQEAEVVAAKVEGHEQFAVRGVSAGRFAVRESEAGFELRLEVDGAQRVWRVPKEPSMRPSDKRMAVGGGVADAPPSGTVWDQGTYEQGGRVPWPEALERGHAVFVLHGERLRGGFALQRTRGTQWLLVKRRDAHAR